jgi:hypothetical protein
MTNLQLAALLCVAVALGHSVIGEWMIFRHMRGSGAATKLVPTDAGPGVREFQLRIIWASWHVLSFLGLAIAYGLWSLPISSAHQGLLAAIASAFAASGLLVAYATRLRHPAWIALLLMAGLVISG